MYKYQVSGLNDINPLLKLLYMAEPLLFVIIVCFAIENNYNQQSKAKCPSDLSTSVSFTLVPTIPICIRSHLEGSARPLVVYFRSKQLELQNAGILFRFSKPQCKVVNVVGKARPNKVLVVLNGIKQAIVFSELLP